MMSKLFENRLLTNALRVLVSISLKLMINLIKMVD